MSKNDLCKKIQIDAFDLRLGELSPEEQATLEAHIEHCASCRDYVERLGDMLDEATIWDPADPVPFDTNALFDRIEQTIDSPDTGVTRGDDARLGSPGESWPAAPPSVGQRSGVRAAGFGPLHRDKVRSTETHRIDEPHEGGGRRSASVAHLIITLAAALVAFLAWPLIFSTWFDGSDEAPIALATRTAETGAGAAQDGEGAASAATSRETDFPAASAPVEPTLELEALRLFAANDDARWSISVLENGWEVDVRAGTLVLEFLPTDNQTLEVRFPGAEATVLGTAFYVDADQAELGVITGEVVVRGEDTPEQPVLGGSAWVEGRQRPIPPTRWESVTTRVDPESHRARQELAKEAARARGSSSAKPPEEPAAPTSTATPREVRKAGASARVPGPAMLRLEAEEAMRRRDFSGAAGRYEDLLRVLGPRDRAAATVRLDLALLYYRQLGDERRAIEHLNYFVDTWPDDMAAPIAISELCRLLGEERAQSEHCGGR